MCRSGYDVGRWIGQTNREVIERSVLVHATLRSVIKLGLVHLLMKRKEIIEWIHSCKIEFFKIRVELLSVCYKRFAVDSSNRI